MFVLALSLDFQECKQTCLCAFTFPVKISTVLVHKHCRREFTIT